MARANRRIGADRRARANRKIGARCRAVSRANRAGHGTDSDDSCARDFASAGHCVEPSSCGEPGASPAAGRPVTSADPSMAGPAAGGGGAEVGAGAVLRLLRLARPLRSRLLIAVAAGALATGCGVALLAVSGFLLARASQHPDIAALSVAVVAVRALSVGRGGFRYAERLASHDVAFRVLAQVRVAIWSRLEALAPAGLPAFRSGDLLARLVSDVDSTQDLFIRGITPPLAAALVGSAAVLACLFL